MIPAQIISAILFGFLFSLVPLSPSHALTIPQTFHLDGLTFSQPLTMTNPDSAQSIQFGTTEKLMIKKSTAPHVLAEKIVQPTPVARKLDPLSLIPVAEASGAILPSVSPTLSPTLTQTPTPTPIKSEPTPQAASVTANPGGGLDTEKLFSMINAHRASIGLASFQKDANLCSIAQSRAPELTSEIMNGTIHAGFRNRNLPYWATENMIHQNTESEAFNWWMNSSLHRSAIEGSHTHACGACQGKSCAMIFTSFQPK